MSNKDTIIAVATGATSSGGLGVIRISGSKAKAILHAVFMPKHGKTVDSFEFKPRYMHYGSFVLQKEQPLVLDEILAVYFPAPFSYTGEDVVEIHAHGGAALLQSMLEHLLVIGNALYKNAEKQGNHSLDNTLVRHAQAGEFTKRAFLNGRIDLSQAEAVAEIIAAPAVEGVKLAAAKLNGALGKRIEHLRAQIEYIRRRLCLAIDFPEEEGECLPLHEFHALLDTLQSDMSQLISAYDRARPWSEGSLVVLAGQVNAGKSSLMNAILGRKRAIVTSQAGTTRDYLEENTFLDGLSVRLTDTAGLREIAWLVERASDALRAQETQTDKNSSVHIVHTAHNSFQSARQKNTETQENDFDVTLLRPEILERLQNALNTLHSAHPNANTTNNKNTTNNVHSTNNKQDISTQTQHATPISLIEAEGICRSLELMEEADLILLVLDGHSLTARFTNHINNLPKKNPLNYTPREKAEILALFLQEDIQILPEHVKKIALWNKTDTAPLEIECVNALQDILNIELLCVNAKENMLAQTTNTNTFAPSYTMDNLAKYARKLLVSQDVINDEIAPNRRQAELLKNASQELAYLKQEIDILPPDLTAIRLESAGQLLSSITGICTIDETFNAIFEDFCIGK